MGLPRQAAHGRGFRIQRDHPGRSPDAGDWELGIGPGGNNSAVTANLTPFHPDNLERRFEIGYTAATRTAYLRYFHTNTTATTVSYTTTYAYSPAAMLRWEIPSTDFMCKPITGIARSRSE